MILPIAEDATLLIKAAAQAILVLHIGGGVVGLAGGAVAVFARKGGRLHRTAGKAFVVGMLTMAAIGAGVSPFLPDRLSACMGLFTFYLVASAWLAVRRPAGQVGELEVANLLMGAGAAVLLFWLAGVGAMTPSGTIDGLPYQIGIVFGLVAALGAACDLKVILAGGIAGPRRIARHLWRMCLALAIASGSLFQGQPQVFPEPLRGSVLLLVPTLGSLALLGFWMLRTRLGRTPRRPVVDWVSGAPGVG